MGEKCLKCEHPASQSMRKPARCRFLGTSVNSPKLTLKTLQTVSQKTKHQGAYLAFFPIEKPLSFLAGSVLPLLAQNLSTPLLMTLPKFFTTSSSPGDEPTFSKSLEVFPLRLLELRTSKHRKQTPQKQSTPHLSFESVAPVQLISALFQDARLSSWHYGIKYLF